MWSNKYLGIPYLSGGRDENGIDCWGLVRLVYKEEYNIELPSFSGDYLEDDRERSQELINQYREGWEEIQFPTEGCVVLLKVMGFVSHIGICINDHQFLHVQDGAGSSIQDIAGTKWKNRVFGYFRYRENTGVVLNAVPHPLRTERVTLGIAPGTNLEEIYNRITTEYNIPSELQKNVHIFVNGILVPRPAWLSTVLKSTDVVEYRSVPGKDVLRIVAFIVLAVYAPQIAAGLESAMFATEVGMALGSSAIGAKMVAFAATAAVSLAGNALINAIFPVRQPPEPGDPGQSTRQLMVEGVQNQINQYGAIPVVLGKVRMTPPLGMKSYSSFETNSGDASKNYLNMMLVWGYGPLSIDEATFKIGNNDYISYEGTTKQTLTGQAAPTAGQIAQFSTITAGDVYQDFKGVELTGFLYKEITTQDATYQTNKGVNQATWNAQYNNGTYYMQQRNSSGGIPTGQDGVYYNTWTPYSYSYSTEYNDYSDVQVYSRVYTLTSSQWIESTINQKVQKVTLAIAFPQGLRKVFIKGENAGQTAPTNVEFGVEVQYKTGNVWETGWTPLPNINVLRDAKDAFTFTQTYYTSQQTVVVNGQSTTVTPSIASGKDGYRFRIRRFTSGDSEPNDTERLSHSSVLHSFTGYYEDPNYPAWNWGPDTPSGTFIAKTAIRVQATDQLNGNIEGISGVVQSICKIWNGSNWNTQAPTSNPAALFRYVLTHPANPQRILESEVESKIDLAAIQDWYNYCETYQIPVGPSSFISKKLEYNSVLGNQRSVLEVLRDICAAGRASPALKDGKWTITIDRPQNVVVQHFTPHNSWGFESTKALPKYPHAFKVRFFNEEKNYQEDEVIILSAGYTLQTAELFESIELPGITNKNLAEDFGRWHYAQIKLRPEIYTINTDLEYLVCNRGDRVKVLHDVPMWGLQSGRIKNRLSDTILELDEPVPIEENLNYAIRFRGVTNTGVNKVLDTEKQVKTTFNLTAYSVSTIGKIVTITLGSHPLQIGDRVNVSITGASLASNTNAEITEVTSTTFSYVDNNNLNYVAADTPASGTVKLKTGNYKKIQITTSTTADQAANSDLFMFGKLLQETQDLVVTAIEPTNGARNARLTLVDYGIQQAVPGLTDGYNIFTDYYNYTSLSYFANISDTSALNYEKIGNRKPTILNVDVVSDDSIMTKTSVGTYEYGIRVPFLNDLTISFRTVTVEGQIDMTTSGGSSLETIYNSFYEDAKKSSITFTDVQEGKTYRFRLRYVGVGNDYGPWTEWSSHTVVGKIAPPQAVTGLTYTITDVGIEIKWDPSTASDYRSTIVRDITGTTWSLADTLFDGTANSWLWTNAETGTYTLDVRHVDTSDIVSLPATVTFYYSKIALNDITVELDNDTHFVPSESDGSSPFLAQSGTKIYVYYANTLLKYDGVGTANGRWKINSKTNSFGVTSGSIAAVSNATTGDDYATIGDLTAFTQDTGTVTFEITGKDVYGNSFTVSDYQKLSKQKNGQNPVIYRLSTTTPVVYKASEDNNISGVFTSLTVDSYRYIGAGSREAYGWIGVTPYVNSTPGTEVYSYRSYTATPNNSDETTHFILKMYGEDGGGNRESTPVLDEEEIRVVFQGRSVINLKLDNEVHVVPANTDGSIISLTGAVSTATVFKGGADDSSNWTFSNTAGPGITFTASNSNRTVTITDITQDLSYVDITAARTGYASQTVRFTVSRNRNGPGAVAANLTNDSHVLDADQDGLVSSYDGASTTIDVNIGGIDDSANWTYTTNPASNAAFTYTFDNRVLTVTNLVANQNTAYVDITASKSGYASQTVRFSISKSKTGKVNIIYGIEKSAEVLSKNQANVFTPSTITFTARRIVGEQAPESYSGRFKIYENGSTSPSYISSSNESSYTYTPGTTCTSIIIELYEGGGTTTLLDVESVAAVAEGASALSVELSNDAHVFTTDSSGTVQTYSGSGTEIRVFQGATLLNYNGVGTTTGTWKVVAAATGITAGPVSDGGNQAVYGNTADMTGDTANIVYTITGRSQQNVAFTLTKTQVFGKGKQGIQGLPGQDGDDGTDGDPGPEGARSATVYFFRDTPSSGAPTAPTGYSYNFSTGNSSITDSGWSNQLPTSPTYSNQVNQNKLWAIRVTFQEVTYGGTVNASVVGPFVWTSFDGLVTFSNLSAGKDSAGNNTTFIDGGAITANSITAARGQIADLTVGTIKIQNQAVTVANSIYSSSTVRNTAANSWQDVVTLTVTTTGARVFISFSGIAQIGSWGSGEASGTTIAEVRLYNTTTGAELLTPITNLYRGSVAGTFSQQLAAGTYTYAIQVRSTGIEGLPVNQYAGVQGGSLFILETKK